MMAASDLLSAMEQWSGKIDSGMPLVQSLREVAATVPTAEVKDSLENMATELASGQVPSVTMAKYPAVFPPTWIPVVRQGELTGKLEDAIRLLF